MESINTPCPNNHQKRSPSGHRGLTGSGSRKRGAPARNGAGALVEIPDPRPGVQPNASTDTARLERRLSQVAALAAIPGARMPSRPAGRQRAPACGPMGRFGPTPGRNQQDMGKIHRDRPKPSDLVTSLSWGRSRGGRSPGRARGLENRRPRTNQRRWHQTSSTSDSWTLASGRASKRASLQPPGRSCGPPVDLSGAYQGRPNIQMLSHTVVPTGINHSRTIPVCSGKELQLKRTS